ncbi:hypothetical protein CLU79DRAFT_696360 [Phycomyces nitens]|nr:hypothetical protein CLU79DRAFT_696360 [Phycomyces nitens]
MENLINIASVKPIPGEVVVEKMLELEDELRANNIKGSPTTYEFILSVYSIVGDRKQGLLLLREMKSKNIRPHRSFFHRALHLAGRFGDSILQGEILNEMEASEYPKTHRTYQEMIFCMRNNEELEHAMDTFETMKREGINPSLLVYMSMINLSMTCNYPSLAYELLNSASKQIGYEKSHDRLYMDILRAAAFNGEYDIVKSTWAKISTMEEMFPDNGLHHYILQTAASNNDFELANGVIQMIGKQGLPYSETHFIPLIQAYASTSDMKSTFKVLHIMRKVGLIPTKYSVIPIAHKLGKDINAVRKAREAIEQLAEEEKSSDILEFNLVIHSFAYNGDYDEAMETYYTAVDLSLNMNTGTIDALLDACIHAERADMGVQVYDKLTQQGIKPTSTTLSKMVTLLCTQEDFEDAFVYLEKMKSLDMVPLRGCYYKLIRKLAYVNDPRLEMAIEDMEGCGHAMTNNLLEYIEEKAEYHNPGKQKRTKQEVEFEKRFKKGYR